VRQYAAAARLPYRYMQLDDWVWPCAQPVACEPGYNGTDTGQASWSAREAVFPRGLPSFRRSLGLPLLGYSRWWSRANTYSSFEWVHSPSSKFAFPRDPYRFFGALLDEAVRDWGLVMFEQDWMDRELTAPHLVQRVGGLSGYFEAMGAAAAERNLTVAMGTGFAHEVLMSVQVPAIAFVFAGANPIPSAGTAGWQVGRVAAFLRPLSLLPFKDSFWTTSYAGADVPNWPKPYGAWTDNELHAMVAALSAAPVGVADRINTTDVSMVLSTCRADGTLLAPDLPAAAMDAALHPTFVGELTHATVDHSAGRWHLVLGADLGGSHEVSLSDLGELPTSVLLGIEHRGQSLVQVDASSPLLVGGARRRSGSWARWGFGSGQAPAPQVETVNFELFTLAPAWVRPGGSGLALLGEKAKYVGIARARFTSVTMDTASLSLEATLTGTAGEHVTIQMARTPCRDTESLEFEESANGKPSGWDMFEVNCILASRGAEALERDGTRSTQHSSSPQSHRAASDGRAVLRCSSDTQSAQCSCNSD
jgi:hypothetical protein